MQGAERSRASVGALHFLRAGNADWEVSDTVRRLDLGIPQNAAPGVKDSLRWYASPGAGFCGIPLAEASKINGRRHSEP